ncbi:glutathione S-transferase family protein [Sphingomonas sp. SRS2]|uniref:glutathione S-transferase family protein n=1 Tax=Sphingomonas sp. SRS2 TaxID=133190 RepID=UPI0006184AB2|nr:glutathione S-transferase N-terminal domain-containing protein [Sphingomonas sp. SRS2]KKC27224.1 glutathione S-transferase [Sphingomonas sp. SRS2]
MKLGYSPNSPYVRKVMICAILRGLEPRIERFTERGAALLRHNPLSKVPTLVLDDGTALFDSPVICEYLDSIGDAPKLFPDDVKARWTALRRQALGDGIMDASQPRRREVALPQDQGRQDYIMAQQAKVEAAIDLLESEADSLKDLATIGEITIGCALGYLDFRFPHEPWRPDHPKLEAWYARVSAMPALAVTAPTG